VERIERLIGVYDADGSLFGELSYVVGHALGRRSCALCDITHGRLRRKPAFDAAVKRLAAPFELLHRDEQMPQLAATTEGSLPCVVAGRGDDLTVLVGPGALAACAGDPAALMDAIRQAAAAEGLALDTT
jgi:hypothetical protein